ncbi:MAG: RluA family pseudouridine synthase [Alphaproteobacteria bacterium]|nr:RluA family pseudouridine synthase [Alphaproteobacteria bacterium]
MANKTLLKLAIPLALQGQRLDKVLTVLLAEQMPAFSRARLQALIEDGHVSLSGKVVSSGSRKVRSGESYHVKLPPPESAVPKAQKMALKVVFEDKDLLVIDKPPGMVVHPAPGNRDQTLVNALLAHCGKSLSGIGGVMRPGIVHRLDKDTSGLMVVAKNDLAHQGLTKQFADRSLSRIYQALVWGHPVPKVGSIEASIGRHPRDRKKMAVIGKGRSALTYYKVIKILDETSLVECTLATGRTHQIRVHLAHRKYPVVGDTVYGGQKPKIFPRQALHAMELKFQHPRTGKTMRFTSALPKDMAALLRNLESGKK